MLEFPTFASGLESLGDRCIICSKKFTQSNMKLGKKSASQEVAHYPAELTFSLVNNTIRIKIPTKANASLHFYCENNRHHHKMKFLFHYDLEKMLTPKINLSSEEIVFKQDGVKYCLTVNYNKPESGIQVGASHLIKPNILKFDRNKQDLIDKINRLFTML